MIDPAPVAVSVPGASHVLQEMATQAQGNYLPGLHAEKKHRGEVTKFQVGLLNEVKILRSDGQ
jgi:hypothetical protein